MRWGMTGKAEAGTWKEKGNNAGQTGIVAFERKGNDGTENGDYRRRRSRSAMPASPAMLAEEASGTWLKLRLSIPCRPLEP